MTMRILQVNSADRGGGAEAVALQLHRAGLAHGHHATLAVGRARTGEPGVVLIPPGGRLRRLHDELRERGRHRLALAARVLGDPRVAGDLARGREDFRHPGTRHVLELARGADVVHLHNLHGWYFDLTLLPALTAMRPTVLTLHDEWAYTGHCAHTLGCDGWRTGCGHCPHLGVYPRLLRDGTAANLARKRSLHAGSALRLVAPVRWLLERALQSALAPAVRSAEVIENGVDLDRFSPPVDRRALRLRLGLPADAQVLVFAAQGAPDNPFKDLETLERALDALGTSGGAPIVAVVLGADGSSAASGRVEIRRLGVVTSATVADHLRAADVYVHPARADTQPLAILEALACGTPVVASRVGGIPETVEDGETGLLVAPGNPGALARALARVCEDGELRSRLSAEGRAVAEQRFSLARQTASYLALYEGAATSG